MQKTGVQNAGLQKTGVQKTGLQNAGVQKTGVQKTGLQNAGLQKICLHSEILSTRWLVLVSLGVLSIIAMIHIVDISFYKRYGVV